MLKMLLCLIFALALAGVVLQLRQQQLELDHQANLLHTEIEAQQAKLWNQQLQIATYTAPNAIESTVNGHDMRLINLTTQPSLPTPPAPHNSAAHPTPTPARHRH